MDRNALTQTYKSHCHGDACGHTHDPPSGLQVTFVFTSVTVKTTAEYAALYIVLILIGVFERCLSRVADMFPLKYVLMMALMSNTVPVLMVICSGLALGFLLIQLFQHRKILVPKLFQSSNKNNSDQDGDLTSDTPRSFDDGKSKTQTSTSDILNEPCC
ncbi:hypothetical protein AX774_g7349 [Zancudomyces culisetae]|uniref:Uncharacterized protein n=1 Tax=Zancudomyces culisetae TaxID=1213189 RepID=A0A1R1PE44_ZANCU|nr:hypothetical protein AX774_g7349 [Zancudomyces culisetae]|eukprot:OMH79247.1 hypothetical protein AX774_g7349 [Zancudomyces culisetae]